MSCKMRLSLLILTVILCFSCSKSEQERKVDNIRAFARCYGYVRWFHPSDEAQKVDWKKFIPYGLEKVKDAPTDKALRDSLIKVFKPIAPSIEIVMSEDDYKYDFNALLPKDTIGLKPTYWQHNGVDLGLMSNMYRSIRVNAVNKTDNFSKTAILHFTNAYDYKGKEVRIKAAVKVIGDEETYGNLLLCSHNNESPMVCIHDKVERITSNEWKEYEKIIKVGMEHTLIDFGCYMEGTGEMYVDNLSVSYKDNGKWKNIIKDDFEGDEIERWKVYDNEFEKEIAATDKYKGKSSLHVKYNGKLFDEELHYGDITENNLTDDIKVYLPLVLMKDSKTVYPKGDTSSLRDLLKDLNDFYSIGKIMELSDIVEYWNVIKYFHPHLDTRGVDWDLCLEKAIYNCLSDNTDFDGESSLSYLCNKIEDAHTGLHDGRSQYKTCLPFYAKLVENRLIVTNSNSEKIKRGDELVKIDGESARKVFDRKARRWSGRADLKNKFTCYDWLLMSTDTPQKIQVNRDGKLIEEEIVPQSKYCRDIEIRRNPVIKTEKYTYVDLGRVPLNELKKMNLDLYTESHYNIYDLRNVIYMPYLILPDSVRMKNQSQGGIVKHVFSPDRYSCDSLHYEIVDNAGKECKKNIFLVDEGNMSNNEAFVDFIHENNLGITVGKYTTGANGYTNLIEFPSGKKLAFTGMKYYYHDGKNYYAKGIKPDVFVQESIEGVLNNQDEIFNKAIEIANNGGIK